MIGEWIGNGKRWIGNDREWIEKRKRLDIK